MTKSTSARSGAAAFVAAAVIGVALIGAATEAMAQAAAQPAKIDAADTAWMISATALVLMMSIPGLALFYSGMVRKKNVLATMAQTLAAVALGSLLWALIGYSLAFTGEGPAIGTFERIMLSGMGTSKSAIRRNATSVGSRPGCEVITSATPMPAATRL